MTCDTLGMHVQFAAFIIFVVNSEKISKIFEQVDHVALVRSVLMFFWIADGFLFPLFEPFFV